MMAAIMCAFFCCHRIPSQKTDIPGLLYHATPPAAATPTTHNPPTITPTMIPMIAPRDRPAGTNRQQS